MPESNGSTISNEQRESLKIVYAGVMYFKKERSGNKDFQKKYNEEVMDFVKSNIKHLGLTRYGYDDTIAQCLEILK